MANSGTELKMARIKAGLTQKQLADKMHCHFTNIARFEKGNHRLKYETKVQLANALNMNVCDIWHDDYGFGIICNSTDDNSKVVNELLAKAISNMTVPQRYKALSAISGILCEAIE